jgi:hypothetical protein
VQNILTLRFEKEANPIEDDGFKSSVLRLLALEFKTLWRMTDCGVGMEIIPPYRTVIVSPDYLERWKVWIERGITESCELQLIMETPEINEKSSLSTTRDAAINLTSRRAGDNSRAR